MSKKALAAVVPEVGKMELREFDLPTIGRDDGLLRVELAGVCGSDPKVYYGKLFPHERPWPLILGHEVVGRIEEIGENLSAKNKVRKGDRIVVEANYGCGECQACIVGDYRFCEKKRRYGSMISSEEPPHLWGGYSQYLYLPPRSMIHKVGEDISPKLGVLICAVIANALRWLRQVGEVSIGEAVVIEGVGQQGLAAVAVAKESGACPIIATGLTQDKHRLGMARRMGADYCINVEQEDVIARVREVTAGQMADVVMDATGNPTGTALVADLLKPKGRFVMPGTYGTSAMVSLALDKFIYKEITIYGVLSHDITSVKPAIKMVQTGKYPWDDMVTHVYPLREAEKAIKVVAGEIEEGHPIKVALDPWL